MVRHAAPFLIRDLGRADVQPAINLLRIAIDNLAIELERQPDGEPALTGTCRPQYQDQW